MTVNNAVVCADVVIVRYSETGGFQFLAVRNDKPAFQGKWAIPGGKLDEDTTLVHTAVREVREETGLQILATDLELLGVFSWVDRDPRFRAVAAAYFYTRILSFNDSLIVSPASDCKALEWFPLTNPGSLAFDHNQYIHLVTRRLLNGLTVRLV